VPTVVGALGLAGVGHGVSNGIENVQKGNNYSAALDFGTAAFAALPFATKGGRSAMFGADARAQTAQTAGKVWNGAGNLAGRAWNGAGNLAGRVFGSSENSLASRALTGAGNWGSRVLTGAGNLGIRAINSTKNGVFDIVDALGPKYAPAEGLSFGGDRPKDIPLIKNEPMRMQSNNPHGPGTSSPQSTRGHEDLPLVGKNGRFQDPETEAAYQRYIERNNARSRRVRDRLEWKEVSDFTKDGPMGRGNKFNETVKERGDYPHDEVHLENGKRVDSYKPPELDSSGKIVSRGEIVSRKAIDFDNITKDSDFTKHLTEMESKYSVGTKIRSDKYDNLDGKTLEGQQILEVPRSNMSSTKKEYYERLAAEKGIEIRYADEY
jgi:hypothetical protein